MPEKKILFFGYTDFAGEMMASTLRNILSQNGYSACLIDKQRYGQTIAEIVLKPEEKTALNPGLPELPGRFVLFCGMKGEELDFALDICRGQLRAVLTPSNSRMTVYKLCEELLAEKKMMG